MVGALWLIALLPLLAAGVSAILPRRRRQWAAALAIGSMVLALGLSCAACLETVSRAAQGAAGQQVVNFPWFQIGADWLQIGWVLDPLTAVMLVMVSFVGLLIFIYSVGYMAHDTNFTRFFCFLSLFAAAMLGLVIANSLLLFFVCWELVGLTSYLLIGFWFHKPAAAAAAKKAFITTRIGDLALLLGMVWLYSRTGTLLFYDSGKGCLEQAAIVNLVAQGTRWGVPVLTAIALLIFCGAIGKSGQVPLHVWLPDAMEGPTPVSALIHAATMVAAGVFLVARVYPLFNGQALSLLATPTAALQVVAWVGAITAVFTATIAVAQSDIKRILAYSTVSQLGFMMMGLGMGGVAVGIFHLITHAFFKALLFMGAGSVIHGCHEEQDVRRMGGLRAFLPITFTTYAIGMMALSGVPLFFSGFWSKDEILHAAHAWPLSHGPFYLGLFGALLTAFYMTRQVFYVFFGNCRLSFGRPMRSEQQTVEHGGVGVRTSAGAEPNGHSLRPGTGALPDAPHESPPVMTVPLLVLAACSVLLGFLGTPAWPWFQAFLDGEATRLDFRRLLEEGTPLVMLLSTVVVFAGISIGWWLYGREPLTQTGADALERRWPNLFALLRRKYFVDEAYEWAVVGLNAWVAKVCDWLDYWVVNGVVTLLSLAAVGFSWVDRFIDEYVVNLGFDESCRSLGKGGRLVTRVQNGRIQTYLKIIGLGTAVLVLVLLWGCRA